MLYLNTGRAPRQTVQPGPHSEADAAWLDLALPTDAERSWAERSTRLRVPAQADLAEVESSSRLAVSGQVLTLSTPMTYLGPGGVSMMAPLGFVLSPDHLITIRFADMPVFDRFAERFQAAEHPCSTAAFVGLLETVVDQLADVLEHVGAEMDGISRGVFGAQDGRNASEVDQTLRATLRGVGRAGERLSNIRDSLLGLSRALAYTQDIADGWLPADLRPRLKTLRGDIASLSEYDNQLANKVQFLLDATLGFINIEQANGIKVLTVVSVVGVPPTLMASIYGMNFKNIPELQWEYGYAYGLTVIVLSGLLPLLWFKKKGWV